MHLPLPIKDNQPPLLGGRRHGREPCTTTLVDGAPLIHLVLTISRLPATSSMATQPLRLIRPGTPSSHVLVRGLVLPTLVCRTVMGRRPVKSRLVHRSPCS